LQIIRLKQWKKGDELVFVACENGDLKLKEMPKTILLSFAIICSLGVDFPKDMERPSLFLNVLSLSWCPSLFFILLISNHPF